MKKQNGFTLLELIVAVVIIGVLAAIAIPQYATYKARAVDSQIETALRNSRTAMEAYFTSNQEYSTDESILEQNGYQPTVGVTIDILSATVANYAVRACKDGGTTLWGFQFDTSSGGVTIPATGACS